MLADTYVLMPDMFLSIFSGSPGVMVRIATSASSIASNFICNSSGLASIAVIELLIAFSLISVTVYSRSFRASVYGELSLFSRIRNTSRGSIARAV